MDILAGLQHTHACGFVHGDLRPSNVLVDEYGILKLRGFGRSRSVGGSGRRGADAGVPEAEAAEAGEGEGAWDGVGPGGDPAYMAPELFSEGPGAMSFASDFWSLGCVLFELLTGEAPFGRSSSASVEESVTREVSSSSSGVVPLLHGLPSILARAAHEVQ